MYDVSDAIIKASVSTASKIGKRHPTGMYLSRISTLNVMAVHALLPLHGQGQQTADGSMKSSTRTEELIREPAQRIARHVRNHSWRETPRKPAQPVSSPNDSKRV